MDAKLFLHVKVICKNYLEKLKNIFTIFQKSLTSFVSFASFLYKEKKSAHNCFVNIMLSKIECELFEVFI